MAARRPAGRGISKGLRFAGLAVVLVSGGAAVFFSPLKDRLLDLAGRYGKASSSAAGDAAAKPVPPTVAPAVTKAVPGRRGGGTRGAAPRLGREGVKPGRGKTPARAALPAPPPAAAAKEKPPTLDLPGMFEEGRSAIIKGDYLTAIDQFEAILKADPNYSGAANLLGVAHGGAKNASQLAVDSGNKAEMSGDYAGAAKQYERALQLDPPSNAARDAMRRLKARMQSEGEDRFKQAKQFDDAGRKEDAISLYEKGLQLLPPDHPSVKVARERLAALKGGM
jgi:tetratricopeptide (TPR) repeat protein